MPVIQLKAVSKAYGGLRPLRIAQLAAESGETVVLQGLDEAAASVLVDLVTGTTLPDEGEVNVAGVTTSSIVDHEAWLAFLEQFGLVNSRVVLLGELTVLQNLAVPFTLDLDPPAPEIRQQVHGLVEAVGLDPRMLELRMGETPPLVHFRVRLGRAIAHAPRVLLVEHPTLGLQDHDAGLCAAALRRVSSAAGRTALVVSNDRRLQDEIGGRQLSWAAGTGRLSEPRRWFRKG